MLTNTFSSFRSALDDPWLNRGYGSAPARQMLIYAAARKAAERDRLKQCRRAHYQY